NSMKYALVTGASSGIGWHISDELARRGYNIVAVSNQSTQLENLKSKLEQFHQIVVETICTDLAIHDAALSVFEHCEQQNLDVEVLVNNAGVLVYGETVTTDYSSVNSLLLLHVTTLAVLCRLFGERMVNQKKGYILNVSSISAVMPYPTISLYGPTKAFIRHFTRALRTEMRPHGIHVTCLMPGATNTSFYEETNFRIKKAYGMGIVKRPETVALAGVKALFNNRVRCIPGFLNKLVVLLLPLIPYSLISLIYKNRFLKK
ncbi:SDR family NAD(P)-dependent oxidoreductase, partial [Bacteroidota bacterium]